MNNPLGQYEVICDSTNNTAEDMENNRLNVDVMLPVDVADPDELKRRVQLIPMEVRSKVHALKESMAHYKTLNSMFGYGEDGSMLIICRSRDAGMRFLVRPDATVNVAWATGDQRDSVDFAVGIDATEIVREVRHYLFAIANGNLLDALEDKQYELDVAIMHAALSTLRRYWNKRKKQARARTGRRS
jgi:hypothetical protein